MKLEIHYFILYYQKLVANILDKERYINIVVVHSCLTLCDPRDSSHQAPLSMGFSRQQYGSGLPVPSPGDIPNPGIEPGDLHCRKTLYLLSHLGSPDINITRV